MSIAIQASYIAPLASLSDDERPILGVKITPSAFMSDTRRPFHLSLLLDTSGSMVGERIEAVKRTLHLLIDAMKDGDVLTLVQYEAYATSVAECVPISASSRVTLHAVADNLYAGGGTNLEAALELLYIITRIAGRPPVDAVFIMTDGRINQGITSTSGLMRILLAGIPAGTPINTLGYGADHNSRMLRDMALLSRGTYTYADAAEMLPAIIGDISSGLETEVGRLGTLIIPEGWECLEMGGAVNAHEFGVGTLIADKGQWVILQGPRKADIVDLPTELRFKWSRYDTSYTDVCSIGEDLTPMEIAEQQDRARVATVFAETSELLERGELSAVRAKLAELSVILQASIAKDRIFAIRLQAQVDEMSGALSGYGGSPPGLQRHPAFGNANANANASVGVYGLPGDNYAPILSRMASNTTALGNQRGFFTSSASATATDPQGPPGTPSMQHTFSSPAQNRATVNMTQRFSEIASPEDTPPASPVYHISGGSPIYLTNLSSDII